MKRFSLSLKTKRTFKDKKNVLAVACPKMLFPYVRETIDGMMTRGTMPPFMLAPVNFEALFAQALQQQQTTDSEETLN